MSRTITVSDELYGRLEQAARKQGVDGVTQLLERVEDLQMLAAEALERRREVVQRINELREQTYEKYGVMPDSVDLISDDRER